MSIDTYTKFMNSEKNKIALKCALLGKAGIGKTSIILRYMKNQFSYSTNPTIDAVFTAQFINNNDNVVKLDIWDTAGQERFESMVPLYYRNAHIILIVYDITDRETYEKAKKWVDRVKRETYVDSIYVLIGNKSDISTDRAVETSELESYAREKDIMFFECSAKTGENVQNIFTSAVHEYLNRSKCEPRIPNLVTNSVDLSRNNNNPSYLNTCIGYINPSSYFKRK